MSCEPVEARDVARRLAELELRLDVLADALGGRGGERHERNLREQLAELRELAIFGTKIVAPLADAVRLVDRYQVHAPALEIGEHPGEHEPLGRGVEQAKLAIVQAAQARARLVGGKRGVQERRRDPAGLQRVHLVLHQGNQRRDNNGQPVAGERRELEAK